MCCEYVGACVFVCVCVSACVRALYKCRMDHVRSCAICHLRPRPAPCPHPVSPPRSSQELFAGDMTPLARICKMTWSAGFLVRPWGGGCVRGSLGPAAVHSRTGKGRDRREAVERAPGEGAQKNSRAKEEGGPQGAPSHVAVAANPRRSCTQPA